VRVGRRRWLDQVADPSDFDPVEYRFHGTIVGVPRCGRWSMF
jgi:hypothetical protein